MSVWIPDSFRLFLCHVSAHKETAETLKAALSIYNVSCFVAHTDIEPAREWQDEIEEALRSMDALAALLTPDFHASNWTDQEVGFAMGRGVLILSLRYGRDPYGFTGIWESSKRTMTMLEECTQLDLDLLERLEKALTENSQVGGAWGVPDRIRALMSKFKKRETI